MSAPSPEHAKALAQELAQSRTEGDTTVAARALAQLGAEAVAAVPDLLALVEHAAPSRAAAAAFVLGEIGPRARDVQPDLVERLAMVLRRAAPEVRHWCAVALARHGATNDELAPLLVEGLRDPDGGVVLACVNALGDLGAAAQAAMPPLVDLLRSSDEAIRAAATRALQRIDPEGARAEPMLCAVYRAAEASATRLAVFEALRRLPTPSPETAALARETLHNDTDRALRAPALAILGRVPMPTDDDARAVAALLSDADAPTRAEAVRTLGQYGALAAPHVGRAVATLSDASAEVRLAGLEALGRLAAHAEPLRPAIEVALNHAAHDPGRRMQQQTIAILAALEGGSQTPGQSLLDSLRAPDPALRLAATKALGGLSGVTEAVRAALKLTLRDEDLRVRVQAAESLAKHGEPGELLLPVLIAALESGDVGVQVAAIHGILATGPYAEEALDAIEALCTHPLAVIREVAAHAVRQIEETIF